MTEPNTTPAPRSYEDRRQDFILAVGLLGGQRRTAEKLDIAERTMRAMMSGERQILDGHMRDITTLLTSHAAACRELAKRTDQLFTANRVPLVPRGRPAGDKAEGAHHG